MSWFMLSYGPPPRGEYYRPESGCSEVTWGGLGGLYELGGLCEIRAIAKLFTYAVRVYVRESVRWERCKNDDSFMRSEESHDIPIPRSGCGVWGL